MGWGEREKGGWTFTDRSQLQHELDTGGRLYFFAVFFVVLDWFTASQHGSTCCARGPGSCRSNFCRRRAARLLPGLGNEHCCPYLFCYRLSCCWGTQLAKKTHCIPIPAPALLWDCWSFSRAPGSGELREPEAEMMVPRGSVRCWLGLSPNYGTKWLTHMRHNELTQDLTAASTAWACARFVRAWIALARCCASRGCPAWWKPPSPCVQLLAAEMCSRIPRGTQCLQELGFVGFGGDPMVFLVTNEFFSSP